MINMSKHDIDEVCRDVLSMARCDQKEFLDWRKLKEEQKLTEMPEPIGAKDYIRLRDSEKFEVEEHQELLERIKLAVDMFLSELK